ncbi:MAG: DUF6893 family small protein [Acidimicrobiales bacterium]
MDKTRLCGPHLVLCRQQHLPNVGEHRMAIVGYVFLALVVLAILAAIILGLVSGGDVKRYLRIRKM